MPTYTVIGEIVKRIRMAMNKRATPVHYLLIVEGDVEPSIRGPYKTEAGRDRQAGLHRKHHGNEDGLYKLTMINGTPRVDSFSGGEMEELAK